MKKQKTFYITTPIYYASGPLHIGHLYCTIMAWVIRNYKKALGYDAKLLTGSDEHGQKIQEKALVAKKEPKQYVDDLVKSYKEMWAKWEIDYDYFSRTTESFHEQAVQKIFSYFLQKGLIYKGSYQGLYSVQDEEFLTKNQAVYKDGKYYHPSSKHELINMEEESYFFKMNEVQKWWSEYNKKHPDFLLPKKVVNEMTNNFVKEGLEDLSVTRTNVKWAIPTIDDPKHTIYVWFDALFNYITKLGFDFNKPKDDFVKYWKNGDEIVHILGKEIARFHFIYWPIVLNCLGIKLPNHIVSHGLLRDKDGLKMSKSLNNVIAPDYLFDKYHHEMIKYYFATQIIFGEDGNFSEEKLKEVVNADLINNYGNLVSRTLKMIHNSFPKGLLYSVNSKKIHKDIEKEIKNFSAQFQKHMDAFEIDKGFKKAIELSAKLNKYIDETTPWKLTDKLEELEPILVRLLNGIYAVSCALQIVLPTKIKEVASVLKVKKFDFEKINDFNKFDKVICDEKYLLFNRLK